MAELVGLEVCDLPDDWIALEAVAVVKCLDENGEPALILRSTLTLAAWEALGMLTAGTRTTEDAVASMFEDENTLDDEDDDDE